LKAIPSCLKQTGNYSYFYRPELERSGITHGFCTRKSIPLPVLPGDREAFLSAFSLLDCVTMEQEHSDRIHVVEEGSPAPTVGDGLILTRKGVAGVIRTADCVPVILWEPTSHVAAIVHAGWRGTVMRIAGKAARMMREMGAEPSLVQALIGPSIGPCCYEVKEDVLSSFRGARFSESIIRRLMNSTFLDLRRANAEDLEEEGVGHIHVLDICTRCTEDLFFSARRNESGRQISFVAITG
jgi:polyphenol oxidase